MTPQPKRVLHFGEFVFDFVSGDLTQNGTRVKINKQVIDLLALLIANQGQLVTREQIREALWPGQAYLNHEKIITNVVSRLRLTLNDDPGRPRFIESIPKRGYRWLWALESIETSAPTESPSLADLSVTTEPGAPMSAKLDPGSLTPDLPQSGGSASWREWRHTVPWIAAAVVAMSIVAISCLFFLKGSRKVSLPAPGQAVSLGIVPFEADTPEARDLADSLRLNLTDALAQLPQIHVRGAHSLEKLSENSATFAENARQLGLDVLLFAKLKLDGRKCTVKIELVRGNDLSHLSSFSFSGPSDDLIHMRDQIQVETFSQLNPASIGTIHIDTTGSPGSTTNRRAYALYLRAGLDLARQTPDSLQAALHGYREAVVADPQFGHAHAHLARTLLYLADNGLASRQQSMNEAMDEAERALSLDPNDPDAHDARGMVYLLRDWNLHAAERELQQAILLAPNEPLHHQWLSLVYGDEDRFSDSLKEIDLAHDEDPYWSSAYITDAHNSSMARDNPHAQKAIHRLLQIVPQSSHALDAIGNAQWYLGNYSEAVASWHAMAVLDGDSRRIALEDRGAAALRSGGPKAYARVRVEAIEEGNNGSNHANDFEPAEWYAMAGDNAKALASLHKNLANRNLWMLEIGFSPAYDSIRSNPDFQAILAQMQAATAQYP